MEKFAYYDTGHEFPEEIVMAAGFTPYKILGNVHESTDPADRYVHNYICPFSSELPHRGHGAFGGVGRDRILPWVRHHQQPV